MTVLGIPETMTCCVIVPTDNIRGNFSFKNWTHKIEPPSQITHFDTPPRYAYTKGDSHFSSSRDAVLCA